MFLIDGLKNLIIGETVESAKAKLNDLNVILRIAEQDGKPGALACNFKNNRVNVVVTGGTITDVIDFG